MSQRSSAKRCEGIFFIIIPLLDCFKSPKPQTEISGLSDMFSSSVPVLMVSFSPECTPQTRSLVRGYFKDGKTCSGLHVLSSLIPSIKYFCLHNLYYFIYLFFTKQNTYLWYYVALKDITLNSTVKSPHNNYIFAHKLYK